MVHLPSDNAAPGIALDAGALARIADALTGLYTDLYEVRPLDPRLSLTDNMLAFVFVDGLPADERLLAAGREERLREFREQFFQVAADEMVGEVSRLTETEVTACFNGFDAKTRTTYLFFVLDLAGRMGAEERRAVLGWSEQVRRNARRLRERHSANRAVHSELRDQWRRRRDSIDRDGPSDDR